MPAAQGIEIAEQHGRGGRIRAYGMQRTNARHRLISPAGP